MKPKYSLGLIETRGMTPILSALDEMLKSADIKLAGFKQSGSAYLTVAICGNIEAVTSAIDIGLTTAQKICDNLNPVIKKAGLGQIISSYIIAKPNIDLIDIFFIKKPGIIYSKGKSIGFIDSRGLISLIAAADIMSKNYPIDIIGYHKMGSGRLNLAIQGSYDSILMAVEMGIEVVKQHGKLIGYNVLANPHPGIAAMLL